MRSLVRPLAGSFLRSFARSSVRPSRRRKRAFAVCCLLQKSAVGLLRQHGESMVFFSRSQNIRSLHSQYREDWQIGWPDRTPGGPEDVLYSKIEHSMGEVVLVCLDIYLYDVQHNGRLCFHSLKRSSCCCCYYNCCSCCTGSRCCFDGNNLQLLCKIKMSRMEAPRRSDKEQQKNS